MKTAKKITWILLVFIVAFLILIAFPWLIFHDNSQDIPKDGPGTGEKHIVYNCPYTEEENIQNIKSRTEEVFAQELNAGLIVDYSVDILYAFDGDPEYFLIELTYKEGYLGNDQETYAHCIGYIEYTQYYVDLDFYELDAPIQSSIVDVKETFRDGKSGYALYASPEEKRYYYEGLHCVERHGEIVVIQDLRCGANTHEHCEDGDCRVGEIISKEEYEHYLMTNWNMPTIRYEKESRLT